ncbi:MAG: fructosamine kinase family protein [Clostridia bacterium]|nr:fructosamine kinase family protein [Clostridia bacterium]
MTLNDALRDAFGAELRRSDPVSGGDINDAFALTLTDGARVFMKSNRAASPAFFQAEAGGLAAIRATGAISVPSVIAVGSDAANGAFLLLQWVDSAPRARDFWEDFGHSLAMMHLAPTPARFGWDHDNYIGASPQINARRESWVAFFRDCRLAPQFDRAKRWFDAGDRGRIDRLLDHLDEHLVEPDRPALLHGDLWSGNFITGSDGRAWLIDPAAYVGHREADLAMTELFGGFHPRFYDAYREARPLQPGYARRRDLYNLYHLLNHLNLFGGGYLGAVRSILKRY